MTDEQHDFTDLEMLSGLYDCVREVVAERDRLRAGVDDWERHVTEKALHDAGKVVWLEACVRELEAERDELRAAVELQRRCEDSFRAALDVSPGEDT